MKMTPLRSWLFLSALAAAFAIPAATDVALAQGQGAAVEDETVDEILVTGSRIRKNPLDEPSPVLDLDEQYMDRTGLTNLGDMLQRLPNAGSAINSQFNVPGNSGFPSDGLGIGAGAVQIALRDLESKRTLVLVNGRRWIAGASASGVPVAVDLNTIPDAAIERIEVLQGGASAIYGSDAIGGVVNIITHDDFEGFKASAQVGSFISDGDGESMEFSGLWGAGNDRSHVVLSVAYTEEKGIETADRPVAAFPVPFTTSCDVPGTRCSSFTPQGRFIVGPVPGLPAGGDLTLNDGVLNDGMMNVPMAPIDANGDGDFDDPGDTPGDFNPFDSSDRFNFNGPGFNFLKTPNERLNIYGSVTHEFNEYFRFVGKAAYTNRSSMTMGAPEPLCLFDCGNAIADSTVIHRDNPFNPFGVDLSVADGTAVFFGRRPLESGGRMFFQDVNTWFVTGGFEGDFQLNDRDFYWDFTLSYGDNRGFQQKFNSHNQARLAVALGDPDVCAATPNCVPFNFFGGQGPNGEGSITQEMLDFVGFTQRDFSEQTLVDISANISGDIATLPGGDLAFAAGFEFRDHEGSFQPDPVAARGETAGIPSGPTDGQFDVTEFYGELNIPLARDLSGADYWEVNVAGRVSDYSTFGSEGTFQVGSLYRPFPDLSLRGEFSTGIRAPGIGELFGGAAREDFTFTDPCSGLMAGDPLFDNCQQLGVPAGFMQLNPQVSAITRGNENLQPETSDSFTFGVVYSPEWVDQQGWVDSLTLSLDYYNTEVDDAVQSLNPGSVATSCVETLNPFFCDQVTRGASGGVSLIDNQLQNIGKIETEGLDFTLNYTGPQTGFGQFRWNFVANHLADYTETTSSPAGTTTTSFDGGITNETFQRAFPEWRWTSVLSWYYKRFTTNLTLRYTSALDELGDDNLPTGDKLDSEIFTDVQVQYVPPVYDDSFVLTLGANNVFDNHPSVCLSACGVVNISTVVHDLPGVVGYLRLTFRR